MPRASARPPPETRCGPWNTSPAVVPTAYGVNWLAPAAAAYDGAIHASHYPGEYTEAALTGVGAFALSLAIASTPIGRRIDALAETVFHADPPMPASV